MDLRLPFFSLALTALCLNASAQDRLYKKDGAMEEVKVKEIGTRTIIYKKWNNQDGPDFVMPKSEISRIKFQNGDEETFDRHDRLRPVKSERASGEKYGKNIFSIAPIQMTNTSVTGIGLSYERILDRNNVVSFYLPIAYSFKRTNNTDNYYGGYNRRTDADVFWFYPGIKVYPTGSNGKVRYGVGASLAFGSGTNDLEQSIWDPATNTYQYYSVKKSVFVMGLLINNSLNIQPTPRVRLGLELGLGIPYFYDDGSKNNNNYYSSPYEDAPLVQFQFNVGYRF